MIEKNIVSFMFWYKWLITVSFIMIIFGLTLIIFNHTPLLQYLLQQINDVFWHDASITPATILFQRWVYSILGAIIAGWAVVMTYISAYPFRNKERWSWDCLTLSLLIWFIPDTCASLYYHVYINVLINFIILIAFAIPLLMSRKYFII